MLMPAFGRVPFQQKDTCHFEKGAGDLFTLLSENSFSHCLVSADHPLAHLTHVILLGRTIIGLLDRRSFTKATNIEGIYLYTRSKLPRLDWIALLWDAKAAVTDIYSEPFPFLEKRVSCMTQVSLLVHSWTPPDSDPCSCWIYGLAVTAIDRRRWLLACLQNHLIGPNELSYLYACSKCQWPVTAFTNKDTGQPPVSHGLRTKVRIANVRMAPKHSGRGKTCPPGSNTAILAYSFCRFG